MLLEQDDSDLIYQLNKHNLSAFKSLYERYWVVMYAHAKRILEDDACAKDVVQDIFFNLYKKMGNINPDTSIKSWLYSCVRNRAIDYIRSTNRRKHHVDELKKYIEWQGCMPEEKLIEKELNEQIDAEIEKLPPRMRRVFELRWRNSLSHQEIAQVTSTSVHTVHSQVQHALKMIRSKLSRKVLDILPVIVLMQRISQYFH